MMTEKYDQAWADGLMKFDKIDIIELLLKVCIQRDALVDYVQVLWFYFQGDSKLLMSNTSEPGRTIF